MLTDDALVVIVIDLSKKRGLKNPVSTLQRYSAGLEPRNSRNLY